MRSFRDWFSVRDGANQPDTSRIIWAMGLWPWLQRIVSIMLMEVGRSTHSKWDYCKTENKSCINGKGVSNMNALTLLFLDAG